MLKVLSLLAHPLELRTLIQFYVGQKFNKRDITSPAEYPATGWDRRTMRRCWELLDEQSTTFPAIIKQLEDEMGRVICLFYLVLRGLDTIEDDMTIPIEIKQPLLRSFHEKTLIPGWNFDGNGPNEKARPLLVEYDVVVEELGRLAPEYREVIVSTSKKMGAGMADFAHKAAATGSVYCETTEEYDLYCHYAAGLCGDGLSGLFAASKKEAPWIKDQLELSNSVGLFLQKAHIIQSYREDVDEQRYLWPREIWGRKAYEFAGVKEMCSGWDTPGGKDVKKRALWAVSGMVVDALRHATDSLDYMQALKNRSIFTFVAILQVIPMATLERCFMNPDLFRSKIKIRKAEGASLIMRSTSCRDVAYIYRDYARRIHARATPDDPNLVGISLVCGKIEQWCEYNYPSFINILQPTELGSSPVVVFNGMDGRSRIVGITQERDVIADARKKGEGIMNITSQHRHADAHGSMWEVYVYVGSAMLLMGLVSLAVVYTLLFFSS